MTHCALASHKGVFKTLFHPIVILNYMRKHKVLEIISELMIRIGIERPSDGEIIDFMITRLVEIARNFKRSERNVMKIEFHNCCSVGMLRELSMRFHIPLVECSPGNYDNEAAKAKACKRHLIICEFDDKSTPEKNHNCHRTMAYLKYLIWNIRVMRKPFKSTIQWNRRVLIVGRMGSGRKTQASLLAHEFGLNLIDCDQTLEEHERTSAGRRRQQQCDMGFWGFVQELLLKPDCLRNGYAIVSNVISREKLEILVEKFIHPPNQIIFIHAGENKCRRRILRQRHEGILSSYRHITSPSPPLSSLSATMPLADINTLLNYHMDQYNLHKHEFISAMSRKIYHVNGNESVSDTRTSIWAHLAYSRDDANERELISQRLCAETISQHK